MINGNGWSKYLVGVLVSLILFICIPTMAAHIIANDKESRERDTKIEEKVNRAIIEQKDSSKAVEVALAKILTKIEYIERAVK